MSNIRWKGTQYELKRRYKAMYKECEKQMKTHEK